MSEMVRYSLNTLPEANEYAAQKRAQDCKEVSVFHHRVTFKPQEILPDIDFRGDAGELIENK